MNKLLLIASALGLTGSNRISNDLLCDLIDENRAQTGIAATMKTQEYRKEGLSINGIPNTISPRTMRKMARKQLVV